MLFICCYIMCGDVIGDVFVVDDDKLIFVGNSIEWLERGKNC